MTPARSVERYYIECFLEANAAAIRGDVLEVQDPAYTIKFGTGVRSSTVVDVEEDNEDATLIADLARPRSLPEARYDCALIVQTIQLVYEIEEVVRNIHRTLTPGGVVLATVPCVGRIDDGSAVDADFWRFTTASARRLFDGVFAGGEIEVGAYGNALAATSFLQGRAADELDEAELDRADPEFPVLIAVRAKKAPAGEMVRARAVEGEIASATCAGVAGWAWDREAPEQRLRLEVWVGDRAAGHVWARAPIDDPAAGMNRAERVGFRYEFEQNLHADPPPAIEVRTTGGERLTTVPRVLDCVCAAAEGATGLRGSYIDSPRPDADLPFPWVDVIGWALGEDAPVEAIELCHRGEPFRRVPVGVRRPDLADAFADAPWAATAGFNARINLVATGGTLDLDVRAVLADDHVVSIGKVRADFAEAPPAPVVMAIAETGDGPAALDRILHEQPPVSRAVLLNGASPAALGSSGHPGVVAGGSGWNEAFDLSDALVWFYIGQSMSPEFLERASAALNERRDASFAVALPPGEAPPASGITSVLSGRALGVGVLFRASGARVLGGLDQGAQDLAVAQWDLAIRLAEAGHDWIPLEDSVPSGTPTLLERCDEHAVRWLYRKHAAALERDLAAVLLDHEAEIGRLLKQNHLKERALESDLRPRLHARRRERDRLSLKLRAGTGKGARGPDPLWGDFRRLEPVNPMRGSERGRGVDRYYLERFLAEHAEDIGGAVLEVGSDMYTRRFGGEAVDRCDVLDIDRTNPEATIFADLRAAPELDAATYDCIVLTQALPAASDAYAVVTECRRLLKPGGTLLATVPCAGRVDAEAGGTSAWWRWSYGAFHGLLAAAFGSDHVRVRPHGSRSAILAFLMGVAAEDVAQRVLGRTDAEAPLVLSARAAVPKEDGSR